MITVKKARLCYVLLGILLGCSCSDVSRDEAAEMDRFVTELMGKMTLHEKLGQLNLPSGGDMVTGTVMNGELSDMIRKQEIGGFFNVKGVLKINALQRLAVEESRLKIPLLVGADVIHGYETIFPIPLALSCSWDTLAIERMARISAIEASADGINWTFSPMVDICRDARWGRIAEGSGEDPYLGSLMARAYVRGYQGNSLQGNDEILACVKHFALYGASESGRDYNTVDMSRLRMYNEYLAPYKAAVDAGVGSVMSSFNIIDGIPATANKWLLTDLLRDEWSFGGLLVTDYNSIAEMASHGIAPLKEASVRALKAGTDMDMVSCGFLNTLEESLKAQGSNIERHLQDYLIKLYNETVPFDQWLQIENAITKEELESAQAAEDQKVYAAFHIREHGHDSIFSTGNGEEFLDVAIRLRHYVRGGASAVRGDFSHHFYKTQSITRERFDELAALRLENTGKVTGAFEIDLDAGWCSALNLADGWQTFKIKDVSTAAYHADRPRSIQRGEQWRKLVDYLYGRDIEPQTFGPVETRGIRPLMEGDLSFSDEIVLSGHELNFKYDFINDEARREVLGTMVDCPEPGDGLDILCHYDAARQDTGSGLSLTLYRHDGLEQRSFSYPLGKEERALLRKQMEADCLGRTGQTLNGYYAQLDLERGESPPELKGGTKRLPVDAVSFTDEITECDGKLNFYIPTYFDPDAVFGTHVCTDANDDWVDVYAGFDWKTGRMDSALTVRLCCTDGHEFEFSYRLSPTEQVQLWEKMDAYCRQQNGQSLEEARAALLQTQAEEGMEIRM